MIRASQPNAVYDKKHHHSRTNHYCVNKCGYDTAMQACSVDGEEAAEVPIGMINIWWIIGAALVIAAAAAMMLVVAWRRGKPADRRE